MARGYRDGAYDTGMGLMATAVMWSRTVLPTVFSRPAFWMFYALHIAVYCAYNMGYLPGSEKSRSALFLEPSNIKVISAMTSFFEVFYTKQAYDRYLSLYFKCREMYDTCCDQVMLLRLFLGPEGQQYSRLCSRYTAASAIMFFYGLNKELDDNQWQEIIGNGLLQPQEKKFICTFTNCDLCDIPLHWSGDVIRAGVVHCKAPANSMRSMFNVALRLRTLQREVADMVALPIPFQYFHLLNLMVLMNLFLWGYFIGTSSSAFAPLVYFFVSLIFIGMLELASQFSNPFGTDEVDFPVNRWLSDLLESMAELLEHNYESQQQNWHAEAMQEDKPMLASQSVATFT